MHAVFGRIHDGGSEAPLAAGRDAGGNKYRPELIGVESRDGREFRFPTNRIVRLPNKG